MIESGLERSGVNQVTGSAYQKVVPPVMLAEAAHNPRQDTKRSLMCQRSLPFCPMVKIPDEKFFKFATSFSSETVFAKCEFYLCAIDGSPGTGGVRNTSGFTVMSPPREPGGCGEARGVPHLGQAKPQ